jgi:DNA-binding MarR family transcriptional regulator
VGGKTMPCELGTPGPVSELEVLAALARAELHATRWKPYPSDIANHLGWRWSGVAARGLYPHLERLASAGQLAPVEPSPRKRSHQQWRVTAAGRRRLASAGPIHLPESPQHRRWRQDRDVAAWALDAVRSQAWDVIEEVSDLLSGPEGDLPTLGDDFVKGLTRRFEKSFRATGLALRMYEQWAEPSDLAADDDAPGTVVDLLPETGRGGRRT